MTSRAPFAHDLRGDLAERGDAGDLSRRERRKREVRGRILEASVDLFEAHGIEATKVIEICDRADVAQKTFFNHFQSKRELLNEIARAGLDKLVVDIEEARKQPLSTSGRIQHFFECISESASEAGPMHRELLTEIVRAAHDNGSLPEQDARRLHDAFAALIDDGLAKGDVSKRHSSETLTEMLMGAYYVLMFNWANLPGYALRERALETARFLGDVMTLDTPDSPTPAERPGAPDRLRRTMETCDE